MNHAFHVIAFTAIYASTFLLAVLLLRGVRRNLRELRDEPDEKNRGHIRKRIWHIAEFGAAMAVLVVALSYF